MAVTIKSKSEIEKMRKAGHILALVQEEMAKHVKPGISTWELDKIGEQKIRELGATPSFLHLYGFPASICISVNDRVVHGIPSKQEILQDGDIVSLDAGVNYQGYHSDAARTVPCGTVSAEAQRLIDVTRQSFFEGIRFATAGNHLYDISAAIEDYVVAHGYSCVRDLVGHGIGSQVHEDPQIPNFRQKRRGIRLAAGMTLAVEPMVNEGRYDVCVLDDDWTVVTDDGLLSAHYENTILITDGEPEILSILK